MIQNLSMSVQKTISTKFGVFFLHTSLSEYCIPRSPFFSGVRFLSIRRLLFSRITINYMTLKKKILNCDHVIFADWMPTAEKPRTPFFQPILLFRPTNIPPPVDPPSPVTCPIAGRYSFVQNALGELEKYATRIRGVTDRPRVQVCSVACV